MRTTAIFKKQLGHGLLETLLVFFVITVGILGIAKLAMTLTKRNTMVNQEHESSVVATKNIELLKNYTNTATYDALSSGSTTVPGANVSYTLNWTITPSINQNYKMIDLMTTWTDQYGAVKTVHMVNGIAKVEPIDSALLMSNIFTPVPQSKPKKKPKK